MHPVGNAEFTRHAFEPITLRSVANQHGFYIGPLCNERHRADEVLDPVLVEEPPGHDQAEAALIQRRKRRLHFLEETGVYTVGERLDARSRRDALPYPSDLTTRSEVVVSRFQEALEDGPPERRSRSFEEVACVVRRNDGGGPDTLRHHSREHRRDVLGVEDVSVLGEGREAMHRRKRMSGPAGGIPGRHPSPPHVDATHYFLLRQARLR